DHNLVFASSALYDGFLGGLAGADAKCAQLAGVVGLTGTFRAYLSTSAVNAVDRLVVPSTTTPARGFVRMDGKPIFDSTDHTRALGRSGYPIHFDETGAALPTYGDLTWTGTSSDGTASGYVCTDWVKPAMGFSGGTYGEGSAGARMWVDSNRS